MTELAAMRGFGFRVQGLGLVTGYECNNSQRSNRSHRRRKNK